MKVRVGFISNSSSSSFVCTYIGIPAKKIIKKKKGKVFIDGKEVEIDTENYEEEEVFESDPPYFLDEFFTKHKVKLAAVGPDIGYVLHSDNGWSDEEGQRNTEPFGDIAKLTKKFEKAKAEFEKIGYKGPLTMRLYTEFEVGY